MAYGLLGVVIFAMTLPMTRWAVGPAGDPQLPPLFVVAGRAAFAGLLSALYLWTTRAPWLRREDLPATLLCAAGTVVGFPLGLGWAVREVEAMHAAVITGVLPLATAVAASLAFRQRASAGFWGCAVAGCALVVAFAARESRGLGAGDAWLLFALLSAAIGYVAGARLSQRASPAQAICWVLVVCLPITVPVAVVTWPRTPVQASAWWGFGYVTLFSMWLGFFAWYRGLALGGSLRVSQVQLVQPFLSMLFAVPLLGERLRWDALAFLLAVVAVAALGRRMPVGAPGSAAGGFFSLRRVIP